jgi:hypothetical protein
MALPLLSILPVVGDILDKIFPDKTAAEAAKVRLVELAQQGELAKLQADTQLATAQAEINKVEAASSSFFVSGARPFIMWICGVGLAMQFLVLPLLTWGCALAGNPITFPSLDMETLLTLLLGLLGLGGLRTIERIKGVIPPGE